MPLLLRLTPPSVPRAQLSRSLPMDGSPSDEAAWLVPDADAPGPWRPFSILPLTTGTHAHSHGISGGGPSGRGAW